MFGVLILASLCIVQLAAAQIRKIPAAVTNAFSDKYPHAKNVEWKDELKDFKVVFSMEVPAASKYSAKFTKDGEWKVTEKEITEKELPAAIRQSLSESLYAEWEVRSVYILYFPDETSEYHIIVAKNDINKKNLLFSKEGRMLKDNFTL